MTPQIQEAFDKKFEEIGEDIWHDIGNDRIFYFGWKACEAVSEKPRATIRRGCRVLSSVSNRECSIKEIEQPLAIPLRLCYARILSR